MLKDSGTRQTADRLPPLAPESVDNLRAMAESTDPRERAKLRSAVSRRPVLLGVLAVEQRRRLAEDARP